jgi:hypothetical protein
VLNHSVPQGVLDDCAGGDLPEPWSRLQDDFLSSGADLFVICAPAVTLVTHQVQRPDLSHAGTPDRPKRGVSVYGFANDLGSLMTQSPGWLRDDAEQSNKEVSISTNDHELLRARGRRTSGVDFKNKDNMLTADGKLISEQKLSQA